VFLLLFRAERHMHCHRKITQENAVAKARRPKRGAVQHTWKVTRRNNQSVNVSADNLSVVDGELVFSTNDIAIRVIAADTYTDVELITAAKSSNAAA
jgi:hypothetical protein